MIDDEGSFQRLFVVWKRRYWHTFFFKFPLIEFGNRLCNWSLKQITFLRFSRRIYYTKKTADFFSSRDEEVSKTEKKNKNNWNKSIIFRKKIPENLKVVMIFFLLKCNEFWKIKSYLKIPKNSVQILQQHVYTSYLGRKRKLVVIHLAGISQGTCRWLLMDKK